MSENTQMPLKKVAVIANSSAGKQTQQAKILNALQKKWPQAALYGVAGYGGELLGDTLPGPAEGAYLEKFSKVMEALLERSPDILVTIGGDGTAAYAADWLLRRNISVPMFGMGAGTANVGPIVTERDPENIPSLEELIPEQMGAVEALTPEGEHIAYGFNDLVLGNTLLGSENGQMVTFEAYAMAAEGKRRVCKCLPSIAGPDFTAEKNGVKLAAKLPNVGQLIASTVERENFYGRAVTGLLCFTPGTPYQASVFVSAVPIVTCEESSEGFDDWFCGAQLLLQPGDKLILRGLANTVCAVADGNPYVLPEGNVLLEYKPNLLTVLKRR